MLIKLCAAVIFFFALNLSLKGQFSSGATSLTEPRLIDKEWHLNSKKDGNPIVRVSGGNVYANNNIINAASTLVIDDGPADNKWWTSDERWFHIKSSATGQYLTVNGNSGPVAALMAPLIEGEGASIYPQQFRLIATLQLGWYKIRSRSGGLVLEVNENGELIANDPKLDPSEEQKFAFNLAMPDNSRAVIMNASNRHFFSDNGILIEGTPAVHIKNTNSSVIWQFLNAGSGYYRIYNTLTKRNLALPSGGGGGSALIMTSSTGTNSQWKLIRNNHTFFIVNRANEALHIGMNNQPASGNPLYCIENFGEIGGLNWVFSVIPDDPEIIDAEFEKISEADLEISCAPIYGQEFKRALIERVGLNANNLNTIDPYFSFIREALASSEGADKVDEMLMKFDLNNTGHRIDLALITRKYITETLPLSPRQNWSYGTNLAVSEYEAKTLALRIDYANRIIESWNDHEAQYASESWGFSQLIDNIDASGYVWPDVYPISGIQSELIVDYTVAAKNFGYTNAALVGSYALGVSVVMGYYAASLSSAVFTALPLSAATTYGPAVVSIVSGGGPVVAIATFAAAVLAVKAMEVAELQRLLNDIDAQILEASVPVFFDQIFNSVNLVHQTKLLSDLDYILGASMVDGFQYNFDDNTYLPLFNIDCASNITLPLDENGQATLTPQLSAGISQNCGTEILYFWTKSQFDCEDANQTHQVIFVARNKVDESSMDFYVQRCTLAVTIVDDIPATITCPVDQTLILESNCSAIMPDYTGLASGLSDNCGITVVTQSFEAGYPVSGAGDMIMTLRVQTESNTSSTCTFTLHKIDVVPPFLLCPLPYTLELGTDCSASLPNFSDLTTFFDNCGEANFEQFPSAGTSVEGIGSLTMTLQVTDEGGVSNSCEFTINMVDNMEPVINCPLNQVLEMGENCSATFPDYRTLATITENCENFTVTQSVMPGTIVSGTGNISVTLTVTDVSSNSDQCSFVVSRVDNILPTIICPSTQTVILNENCEATLTDYGVFTPSADNCGVSSVTQSPLPGSSISGAGNMTVTLRATDMSGNTGECTMLLVKSDNTAPSIVCFPQTINFNGESSFALESHQLSDVSDNCGILNTVLSINQITCANAGQSVPVTVTVTDLSGNTSSCVSEITVNGLPCGWTQNQDGINCTNGNNIHYNGNSNIWTVTSTNCFYANPFTSDVTAFAQRTLCGDGSITAKVNSINTSLGWAGVVMRENNSAGAKKAQLTTNMGTFHRREFRTVTGGAAAPQQIPGQNRFWLRIERSGNQFSMYTSQNGQSWQFVGAQTIVMSNCIEIGLVASNYSSSSTVSAIIGNVSYVGSSSQSMQIPDTYVQTGEVSHEISVYPNPSSGMVNIDAGPFTGLSTEIELYSLQGQLLDSRKLDNASNMVQLDLSNYGNGMYVIRMKSPGLPDGIKRIVLSR